MDLFKVITVFLILEFSVSCKNETKKEPAALEFCKQTGIDYCNKTVVIIPSSGCGSCISAGIDFLKKYNGSAKYEFVFVEIRDKKRVKSLLGGYSHYSNIHLDTLGLASSRGLSKEYPVILKTDYCEISEVIIADLKSKGIWDRL